MAPADPPKPPGGAVTVNPYMVAPSPFYAHVAHPSGPSNIVTTAGQIGRKLDGSIPSDPVEQIEEAFANLSRCLEAAGAQVRDILKLTYYIVDYNHTKPRHRPALLKFLDGHRPNSTLIPLQKLAGPSIIFEIEATAAIPQAPPEHVDVVVVGAGLSGLQAAVDLQEAGLSVKVLEARDRVGGKTWSKPVNGAIHDVGAAWINDSNQSKIHALAKRYELDLVQQNTDGKMIVDHGIGNLKAHPYGQLHSDGNDQAEIDDVIRVRDLFEETCQKIDIGNVVASSQKIHKDLDLLTFHDWILAQGGSQHALNALTIGTRAMLGVEPSEISAAYFLDYAKSGGGYMQMRSDCKDGGQYLRIKQGTQSLARGLASELSPGSLSLLSPVRAIEQQDGLVRVVSARGTYTAARVIVSVPTPLYNEISFSPALPAEKVQLAGATRLGDYCKVITVYKRAWWREAKLCGLAQTVHGPFAVTRDTSNDDRNEYSLTCFVTGQPAREWMRLPPVERRKAVLAKLRSLFGPFATVDEPDDVVEQIWTHEQWSQGCPCPVMAPGGLTAFEHVLREPAGRVHFVGTETAFEWKGYMEGAVRSGERGAQEVLLALDKAKIQVGVDSS
nr:putative flavin-containing monoamine oxidase a [Quercus suber]